MGVIADSLAHIGTVMAQREKRNSEVFPRNAGLLPKSDFTPESS